MKYESIEELYKAVKNGDIDESKLEIIVDNDDTGFYIQPNNDGGWGDEICNGNGYGDVKELYRLLFPKAMVDWC